ncbi:MAG: KOW motif-containing protein [Bacteroidales bacterium]|nr:KOW motif-containing protein [Bacteroidales bacterium]
MSTNKESLSWFAAKVLHNRLQSVKETLEVGGVEYFCPENVIPSLVFVHSDLSTAQTLQQKMFGKMWFYRSLDRSTLARISQKEMEVFMFVVTAGEKGLIYLGDDRPEYHVGDRVRVTDGPFKGAEGHIKRIKKDRRLVVTVSGVAAVATSYIHPDFLQIIESDTDKTVPKP